MRETDRQGIERAIDLCLTAREQVNARTSSRLLLLFDMLLLELAREFARQTDRDEV